MFKGLLVLLLVGIAFAYFVFNFVGDVERNDPQSYISKNERKAKEFARYYEKDVLGEPVLALQGVPMSKAREVWHESQMPKEMLENFPDFEAIREFIHDRIKPSLFRKKLLERVDAIESDYLGGAIDPDTAREKLSNL